MLLLLSHLCGVRLMLSLFSIFFSLFYSLSSSSSSFMFYIVFLLCCYLLLVFVYSFLVIQSDLEKYSKIVMKIFTASMSLSWRIMVNWAYYTMKNLADLLGTKKKTCSHNGRQAFSNPLKNECYWHNLLHFSSIQKIVQRRYEACPVRFAFSQRGYCFCWTVKQAEVSLWWRCQWQG